MDSIVAIDIETTGLDETRDAIIEIGAVKFNGRRITDEYNTLINPNRHVPEFITSLTGIDDAMLRQAPNFASVVPQLAEFVGDAKLLGHNLKFDLSFLQKAGIFKYHSCLDTFELASVLLPSASRYNLGALGQQLGIPLPATHRALDDARVTQACYIRLVDIAGSLPSDALAEIVRLSDPLDWDAAWLFNEVLATRTGQGISQNLNPRNRVKVDQAEGLKKQYALPATPDQPKSIDEEDTAAILEYGGSFSKYFDFYEHRPEQVAMVRAVTRSLSKGNHLLVEAGTGVGKSFAYLVPAALFALQNNTRVVISTNTINLQDQLSKKDIPDLQAALNLELRSAVMKGRGNYLCPRRLEYFRTHGVSTLDELRVLAKILVWQLENDSGDRNAITLTGPAEREFWARLSAEDSACTTETCVGRMDGSCPFHRARQAAQAAHLLVVNHALLLADISTGSRILPEYDFLIIDEGHHLESATTNALAFRMTQSNFDRILRELGGLSSGILGRLLDSVRSLIRPAELGSLQAAIEKITDKAFRLEQIAREFFNTLNQFASSQHEGQPDTGYSWQYRITPSTRTIPAWDEVDLAWSQLEETLSHLLSLLGDLYKNIVSVYADGMDQVEDVIGSLSTLIRSLNEFETSTSGMINKSSPDQIYWIEINPRGDRLSLNAAPLRVGPLVEKYLWHEKASVILTSATLTTHGEFQYLQNTLAADEAEVLSLGSPFDYESSTLIYIANDIPEPNMHGYQMNLEKSILNLARASGGRMLVLFTSYTALRRASHAISAPLAREDIYVYEQGEGASPNALLESFKSTERAVLLGTRSFWEGVDVPGTALSVVVITKLPFDVPSDPLIAARSELYDDPFNQYYLPEAILKFRQGFGRLIRSASDRGVVAILDRRILTKSYGRFFLESLPSCTTRQGSLYAMPKETSQWLGV
jgi:DNA polymerase-3 subunit epsilon/ATP-dependent DNA helicase DinG